MTWDQRLSIRGRLLLLLAAMTLSFAAYLAVSTWRQAADERRHAGEQMFSTSRLTAARLDDRVGDIRQLLAVLAQVAEPDAGSADANDALFARMMPSVPPEIGGLGIWTAEGENVGSGVASTPARFPYGVRRHLFNAAASQRDMVVEAPVVSPDTGEKVALFAIPVVREGRFAGVVAASIKLKTLEGLMSSDLVDAPDAVVTVYDGDGIVIARSIDGDRWVGQRVRPPRSAPSAEGVIDGPSRDGIPRIAAVSHMRRAPWSIYVGIPTDTVLKPVRARTLEYFAVGAAALLASLLSASWIAGRLSSSLRRLGEDAARFEQGEWQHRSTVREGGEIGTLATLMNRMAETLEDRTVMLSASESRLRDITDRLPVLISLLDRDRRFRFANHVYQDWLGLDPDHMIGKTLAEIYGAEAYARFAHHIDAGLAGQRVVYERDLRTPDGLRRIEVSVIPKRGDDDRVEGLYVLMQDVTANREAVARRVHSEERLSLALEGSGAALFDWTLTTGCIFHSAHAAVLRGDPALESVTPAEDIFRLLHEDDVAAVREALEATLRGRVERLDVDYRLSTRSGDWVWIRSRGRVVERDANGQPLRIAGTSIDVTAAKLAEERLRHLATYDTLTGLPNRGLFRDRLAQAIARFQRATDHTTAVLYLDIDHFKAVNDTFGHETGDRLLTDFARALQQTVRGSDTVARLAGDEFAVILEGLRDSHEARQVAQKLVERARRVIGSGGRSVHISTSIGITMMQRDDRDVGQLLARADTALYEAKRAGRDRHSIHGELAVAHEAMALPA